MRCLFWVVFFVPFFTFGQDKLCGSALVNNEAKKNNPAITQLEKVANDFAKSFQAEKAGDNYVIPIVFHVIHNNGGERVSLAQIQDAVRIINEDFQKLNADSDDVVIDFKPIQADMQVEFRLARLDPNGNCTNGVTYTQSELTFSAGENVKNLVGWNTSMYLNVWVVSSIESGAGAYAYYPGWAPSFNNEGIVCSASQLGSIGVSNGGNFSSRTLTHEIGHYLNLPHTWGSTNTPQDPGNCNSDDNVGDTPNTIGSSQGCNKQQSTCGSLDNIQNYMDYASCAMMFTNGQKTRVHAALNSSAGSRNNLWKASNLALTGTSDGYVVSECKPIVDFKQNTFYVCEGGATVDFTDQSYNVDDLSSLTYQWSFPGGNPATSTDKNPSIQYVTKGAYDVTSVVTSVAGGASVTKTQTINVLPSPGEVTTPIVEGFEDVSFPNTGATYEKWRIEGNASPFGFLRITSASSSGSASFRINNRNSSSFPVPRNNYLVSPSIDVSGQTSLFLRFKVAYARTTASSNDRLKIYVSKDCGKSWLLKKFLPASLLITNTGGAPKLSDFTPTATEWKEHSVNLSSSSNVPSIMIRFEVESNDGNYLYLDDINIDNTNAIDDRKNVLSEAVLFPNPVDDMSVVRFTTTRASLVGLRLVDVLGKEVAQIGGRHFLPGTHQVSFKEFSVANIGSGAYFLEIKAGDSVEIIPVLK